MTYFVAPHRSQYDEDASTYTRVYGCVWTSVANGIADTTGGRSTPSPDRIHSLVPRSEETDPRTPGWSIPDAVHAASRWGMALVDRTGDGWDTLIDISNAGHEVLCQGDSDQFGNATCSGAFDGPHCIAIHPEHTVREGIAYRRIKDPICPRSRWERESVIRRYAQDLNSSIRFAAFNGRVPQLTSIPTGDVMARAIRTEERRIASSSVVRVRGGAVLYRDAAGKEKVRTLTESTLLDDFGVPSGTNGWRCVRLLSGQFDSDDDREGGIALVKESDVTGGPRPKTDDELRDTRALFAG